MPRHWKQWLRKSLSSLTTTAGAEDEPVKRLPVLLPHCDEHLVGAVQLLSIFHPHNVRFRHSLNSAAEPDRVALRHRLIGWMFGKQHSCGRNVGASTSHDKVNVYPLPRITKQKGQSSCATTSSESFFFGIIQTFVISAGWHHQLIRPIINHLWHHQPSFPSTDDITKNTSSWIMQRQNYIMNVYNEQTLKYIRTPTLKRIKHLLRALQAVIITRWCTW